MAVLFRDRQEREIGVRQRHVEARAETVRDLVVVLLDALAEVARPRVDHEPDLRSALRIALAVERCRLLQLDEVVAAAERAEVQTVEFRWPEVRAHAVVGRVLLEALPVLRLAVRHALTDRNALLELLLEGAAKRHIRETLRRDIRLSRDHAAADIDTDSRRNHGAVRRDHASDRHPVSLVRIGHQRHVMKHHRMLREIRGLLHRPLLAILAPTLHRHRIPLLKLLPLHIFLLLSQLNP